MQIHEVIYRIATKMYDMLSSAIGAFGISISGYNIILPKWLPQIFIPTDLITIGSEMYPYIKASTLSQMIITIIVYYLAISITYKALKKLFKLGFETFGL